MKFVCVSQRSDGTSQRSYGLILDVLPRGSMDLKFGRASQRSDGFDFGHASKRSDGFEVWTYFLEVRWI